MKVIIKEILSKFDNYEEYQQINADCNFIEIDFKNRSIFLQDSSSSYTVCNFCLDKINIKIFDK